jgi:predicted ATPase
MSYSTMSTASSTNTLNAYFTQFLQICAELQAPDEIIDIVGHDILGFPVLSDRPLDRRKSDSMLIMVIHFMADLILHCTKAFDLAVLILDDVHFMDEMSWKVVQLIFEKAQNTLIICASQCLSSFQLTLSEEFWDSLQENIDGRFCHLKLKPLNESEITDMIAHVFQCPKDLIDEHFSRDIYTQSAGLPLHARELLGSVKHFSFVATSDVGKIGWKSSPGAMDDVSLCDKDSNEIFSCSQANFPGLFFQSNNRSYLPFSKLGELIIHRLDNLEDSIRTTLQICAVLGEDFDVSDLLAVAETANNVDRITLMNSLLEELQVLVNDDILQEIRGNIPDQSDRDLFSEDNSQDRCESDLSLKESALLPIKYRFTHNAWKTAILSMLLVSRKRDIHRNIALAFEAREAILRKKDYRSRLKLFSHWKESGERIKAANVALDILKKFELFGFQNQSLTVISDAIGMWKSPTPTTGSDGKCNNNCHH